MPWQYIATVGRVSLISITPVFKDAFSEKSVHMYDLYSRADYEGTHTLFKIEYPSATVIVEAVLLRILTPPLLLNS